MLEEYYEPLIESQWMPDAILRRGIRLLLSQRERSLYAPSPSPSSASSASDTSFMAIALPFFPFSNFPGLKKSQLVSSTDSNEDVKGDMTVIQDKKSRFVKELKEEKIAVFTEKANEQHYEVPTEFLQICLGDRMKYSCCLYAPGDNLSKAEVRMLDSYIDKAKVKDGMTILDLGCGWGSLSLYLAERFPNAKITALSNSKTQKEYIDDVAHERGFKNLTVITHDVQSFQTEKKFDRIMSIEMLEHMKNYSQLFQKIASWLKQDGLFFCHVFSHRSVPYHFDTDEDNSWMARHFFTGGTMPSHDLFLYFQDHMAVENHWFVNGMNYAKTSLDWLRNLDMDSDKGYEILRKSFNDHPKYQEKQSHEKDAEAKRMVQRWRIFFMAVEELFAWKGGNEWGVTHYLFRKK